MQMSQQLYVKETPWIQYSPEKMIIAPLIINFRFVFKMSHWLNSSGVSGPPVWWCAPLFSHSWPLEVPSLIKESPRNFHLFGAVPILQEERVEI